MCGVVGIVGTNDVNTLLYEALTVLQHRGQDSAGIMTSDRGLFNQRKGVGLVNDVFSSADMESLVGTVGLGHVRYPTAGSNSAALAQPFYVNSPYGIALAHNGNLINTPKLTEELFASDLRHLNTDSDSEVLLNIFARELHRLGKLSPSEEDFFTAVEGVHRRCKGGYAVVAMIADYGMLAFRDPNGIRPLVYGKRETETGTEYMVASESVALSVLGFELVRDVAPGEAILISRDGKLSAKVCAEKTALKPCIFEHVYFARPDSIMDGVSVYKARLRQGEMLADKILREWKDHDIDTVIPIPDSSRVAAQAMAYRLGVKFREGLIKNRYIGRTFIMPGQQQRAKSVRRKLNPIELEFSGKNVLLVDDSIVRGTTSKKIIELARDAGAAKVYFASAAPPIRHPNVYGIDMPTASELLASSRTEQEVCDYIGADKLIYQDLADLIAASRSEYVAVDDFDCSVFNGQYVTGDVDSEYLAEIHAQRNDQTMSARSPEGKAVI